MCWRVVSAQLRQGSTPGASILARRRSMQLRFDIIVPSLRRARTPWLKRGAEFGLERFGSGATGVLLPSPTQRLERQSNGQSNAREGSRRVLSDRNDSSRSPQNSTPRGQPATLGRGSNPLAPTTETGGILTDSAGFFLGRQSNRQSNPSPNSRRDIDAVNRAWPLPDRGPPKRSPTPRSSGCAPRPRTENRRPLSLGERARGADGRHLARARKGRGGRRVGRRPDRVRGWG